MPKMVAARKCGTNIIHSTGPDVLWTPCGSSRVPVAYNSIAFLDKSVDVTTSVKDNGLPDFQLNSRVRTSTGHEPGTGKGVRVAGYKGMAFAKECSGSTGSGGYAVARDGDPAWINRPDRGPQEAQSPMGKFVEETN